ncbi:hypothetical protein PQX77_002346, partial [Marasmius sp. AFHP31]
MASLFVASNAYGMARQTVMFFEVAKTRDLEPLASSKHSHDLILLTRTASLLYPLMNILADIMLVHRCYLLWGSRRFILYALGGTAFVLN